MVVVTDRHSRPTCAVPKLNISLNNVAHIFFISNVAPYGIPDIIISDSGEQFVSTFLIYYETILELKDHKYHLPSSDNRTSGTLQQKAFIETLTVCGQSETRLQHITQPVDLFLQARDLPFHQCLPMLIDAYATHTWPSNTVQLYSTTTR